MRSRVMMILKIARQHAAQVTPAQDDDVIQAFTADRTDEALGVGVLPGRSRGSGGLRRWHRSLNLTLRLNWSSIAISAEAVSDASRLGARPMLAFSARDQLLVDEQSQ